MDLLINDGSCAFNFKDKTFEAQGAWLSSNHGAVYIIKRDGKLIATTWRGETISDKVTLINEWKQYSHYMGFTMRAIRFYYNNKWYSGRYSPDAGELCKVKRVRSYARNKQY